MGKGLRSHWFGIQETLIPVESEEDFADAFDGEQERTRGDSVVCVLTTGKCCPWLRQAGLAEEVPEILLNVLSGYLTLELRREFWTRDTI